MNKELRKLDAYWRAANYLSVGQIYLLRQSAAARTTAAGTHQAAAAGAIGEPRRGCTLSTPISIGRSAPTI